MAAYTLEITRPYSSSKSFELLAWDDEWGRPLNFTVERFSNDRSHVLILLIAGNYPQSLAAVEFDMSSEHSVKSLDLDPSFTRRLSRNCAATLHTIGTTPAGYIVFGTETKDGCIRAERWHSATTELLFATAYRLRWLTITQRTSRLTLPLPSWRLALLSSRDRRDACQHDSESVNVEKSPSHSKSPRHGF